MLNDVQSDSKNDELKELVEKNLVLTQDIHDIAIYIKKYIYWQKIFGFLKLFIILIPIIISIIYLPPLLNEVFEQYKNILNIGASVNSVPSDINEISSDFLRLLK